MNKTIAISLLIGATLSLLIGYLTVETKYYRDNVEIPEYRYNKDSNGGAIEMDGYYKYFTKEDWKMHYMKKKIFKTNLMILALIGGFSLSYLLIENNIKNRK